MLGKSVTGICVVLASVLFGGDAVAMNKADPRLACPGFDVLDEIDIIREIAERAELSFEESLAAFFAMQSVIIEVVNSGGQVDIEEFGSFFEEDQIEVSSVVVQDDGSERTEKSLRLAGQNLSSGDLRQLSAVAMAVMRKGRNPQTGKEIKIAAKNVVKFKAGADLSKSVN